MLEQIDITSKLRENPHLILILKHAINSSENDLALILQDFIEFMSSVDSYKRYEIYLWALSFPKIELEEFVILLEQAILFADSAITISEISLLVDSEEFRRQLASLSIGLNAFAAIYGHLCQAAINATDPGAGSIVDRFARLNHFVSLMSQMYAARSKE